MRSTLPPDAHSPNINSQMCVYAFWVRVDLARIGMIAEFSTLKVSPLSSHTTNARKERGDLFMESRVS